MALEEDNIYSNKSRKVVDKVVIHVKPDSDNSQGIQSYNRDNIEIIKYDVQEILYYSANTTEYHPDGSIVISPHYLSNIPNEIVNLILDHLRQQQDEHRKQSDTYEFALVNRQFYRIANCLLWHTPYIYDANIFQKFQTCLSIAELKQTNTTRSKGLRGKHHVTSHDILLVGHHVRRLTLRASYSSDIEFSLILPYISLLETMAIDDKIGCRNITSASLKHIPRYCPHLLRLILASTPLEQSCIDAIGKQCYQLRELELCSYKLPEDTFKSLADCATSLKSLGVYAHPKSNEMNHFYMTNNQKCHISDDMIKDVTKLNGLTHLHFNNSLLASTSTLLFTVTTDTGATAWPNLSNICILESQLDDTLFIPFIKSHPCLQQVCLYRSRLSDATLATIATELPLLSNLGIRYSSNLVITEDAIYRLIRQCRSLEHLDFIGCVPPLQSIPELSARKRTLTNVDINSIRQRLTQT